MSNLRNKVQLLGYAGKDPEVLRFDNGKIKAAFTLATTEFFRNNEGKTVTDTQWHMIVVWGKLAEVVEKIVQKGTEIMIEGKLIHRSYTDKNNKVRYITEVLAREVNVLDKKNKVTSESEQEDASDSATKKKKTVEA